MNLLRFLFRSSPKAAVIIALAGLVSGLCGAALIALINTSMHRGGVWIVLALVLVGLGKVFAGALSQWLLVRYSQTTLLNLAVELSRKALSAPFQRLEDLGTHRILTALTTDVFVLNNAVQAVPGLAVNAAVIVGSSAYLAWLYPLGFLMVLILGLLGAVVYSFLHKQAFSAIYVSREKRDLLMGYFRGLMDGIKELKLHRSRREEFLSSRIEATAHEVRRYSVEAAKKYVVLDIWNQSLFYLVIGGALIVFPRDTSQSVEVLTGFIFTALYVMTPIWTIIGSIPTFVAGQISFNKIEELGVSLAVAATPRVTMPAIADAPVLELRGVEFSYAVGAGRYTFKLGPIDLTVPPGQTLFLVGGNGSGKTTLVKILTGLYSPTGGEMRLGGIAIDDSTRDWYREHFSVVFSDFYLFDGLLGATGADVDALSNDYLQQLELDGKVAVTNRIFSTTRLSQGQRKRLALLTALIEERPIYVFDEWAADQDPHYKEIFYSKLLPDLKARGKTIIVVTHDDRYFHMGDKVVKLDEGKVARAEVIATVLNTAVQTR